ncbi:glycosyltransferase family 2 protein [Candidatus Pelagibacter sp.]|nr:glycosyltransferase family 2 protein [Candidatus Pelagibacter sp.]MDC6469065.1 glycosyltransferase family 2 protein [Candidatus Pelagibacter sp.]|tara:strand:- start:1306 stop:2232 length:927 start_codon:yes stop_codon:yes gene_type:complete
MTKISIVTPTFNEEQNIKKLCSDIRNEMEKLNIEYEHIVIDNASTDKTIDIIKEICETDKKVKVIINAKNYGHIKSPVYGLMQCKGEACILMASDFQDPVNLITQYIEKWENGSKIVLGEKITSDENSFVFGIRRLFYKFLNRISDTDLTMNTTGSGIFDRSIIEKLKKINDPYPYFRGLISELGEEISTIQFNQPKREFGNTKNNFYTLYDIGMLGVVKHSKMPLRIMILLGFLFSAISLCIALFYLIYKLLFWNSFEVGVAPLIIGIFGFASLQILLLGIIGEYVSVVLTHLRNMPLVEEKERINF